MSESKIILKQDGFQLFGVIPSMDVIEKVMMCFGYRGLDTEYVFTIADLIKQETVDKIQQMSDELREYYLPCKFEKYVNIPNLSEKTSITILRHFVRIVDYKVVSKEKYSQHRKYQVYQIKRVVAEPKEFEVKFD